MPGPPALQLSCVTVLFPDPRLLEVAFIGDSGDGFADVTMQAERKPHFVSESIMYITFRFTLRSGGANACHNFL